MADEKEVFQVVFAILLIAYIISFIEFTLTNYLISVIFATLILLPHIIGHKLAANYFKAEAKFRFLDWKRFGYADESVFKNPFPIWFVLPVLVSFATAGKWIFLTIESFELKWNPKERIGKWYSELEESEISLIAFAGPVVNLILAFIAGIIFSLTGFIWAKEFAIYSTWFAFFNLIPIGNLDGSKAFFGGPIRWAIIFAFTVLTLILMYFINIYITAIIALILALVIGLWLLRLEIPHSNSSSPFGHDPSN